MRHYVVAKPGFGHKPTEYALKDDKDKTVAMGSLDQMFRYVKHHVPDGNYTIRGQATDLILERRGGVVYPTGGTLKGERVPPRSTQEAHDLFVGEMGIDPKPTMTKITISPQNYPGWVLMGEQDAPISDRSGKGGVICFETKKEAEQMSTFVRAQTPCRVDKLSFGEWLGWLRDFDKAGTHYIYIHIHCDGKTIRRGELPIAEILKNHMSDYTTLDNPGGIVDGAHTFDVILSNPPFNSPI